ncbi:MAG TPA: SDR family NAD(P)-dependent oxidoreductase [Acidimicrobiales bacterium]|nr:SDR family NAD(P)-dependent oxidoreductase [Acidimicrobiales bacterium]
MLTGAAGGVGRVLTEALVARGYLVYAAARRPDDPRLVEGSRVRPVSLDVTDPESVARAAAEVAGAQEGRGLHAVINNAGLIVQGPIELLAPADLRLQFDVNVIGPATVLGAFLPLLRAGRGRVVNISAATARVAVPMMGPIAASKAALESLSDALRVELAPWGIPVSIVEPGAMETSIFAKAAAQAGGALAAVPAERRALYEPSLAAVAEANASATLHPVDTIVGPVLAALSARRPKPRYVSGSDARALVMLAHLPVRTRDRVRARALGLHRLPRAAEGPPAAPGPGAATEPGGAAA